MSRRRRQRQRDNLHRHSPGGAAYQTSHTYCDAKMCINRLRNRGIAADILDGPMVLSEKIRSLLPDTAPVISPVVLLAQFTQTPLHPTLPPKPIQREREPRRRRRPRLHKSRAAQSADFYLTDAWRELRYQILKARGRQCECCGTTPHQGAIMHVDHIKPRSLYPHLELVASNLQVLCEDCNIGKKNHDEIAWASHPVGRPQ